MVEVVNLRRARKARERADRAAAAEMNRLAFGRSKAEKRTIEAREVQAERHLDGHKRELPPRDDA